MYNRVDGKSFYIRQNFRDYSREQQFTPVYTLIESVSLRAARKIGIRSHAFQGIFEGFGFFNYSVFSRGFGLSLLRFQTVSICKQVKSVAPFSCRLAEKYRNSNAVRLSFYSGNNHRKNSLNRESKHRLKASCFGKPKDRAEARAQYLLFKKTQIGSCYYSKIGI